MAWLGVRCWKDKVALAIVDNSATGPALTFDRRQQMPKGDADVGRQARWFFQVVEEALADTGADGLAICVSSGDADQTRASFEGAAAVAAGMRGVPVQLMRKQGMWKPLGLADRKSGTWSDFMKHDALMSALVGDLKEAAAASLAAERRGTA
ncbi:MAG: hypothetical protein ACLGI8_12760 [Acidimicrobiia bacterium]